jgi:hypothetical protein
LLNIIFLLRGTLKNKSGRKKQEELEKKKQEATETKK